MKKIGQFILTDKVIKKMRDKIQKNNNAIKRELGFSLFQKDNILIDRWHCTGNKDSIFPSDKCINGEELVGGFHTHPTNSEPSMGDLQNAYIEGFECIGGFLDQKIVCYIRNVKFDNSHLDDIKLTRKKLIDMSHHVKAIEKIKPKYRDEYKQSKIIKEYKDTMNREKTRILEKYFDIIEL